VRTRIIIIIAIIIIALFSERGEMLQCVERPKMRGVEWSRMQPRVRDNESHEEECLRDFPPPPLSLSLSLSGLYRQQQLGFHIPERSCSVTAVVTTANSQKRIPESSTETGSNSRSPWTSGSQLAARSRNYVVDIMQMSIDRRREGSRRVLINRDISAKTRAYRVNRKSV